MSAFALDLATALPGWEIQLGTLRPEGPLSDRVLYRLSARDERNSRAILTLRGEWVTHPDQVGPTLIRGLILHGGLSTQEKEAIAELLPGGGL